MKQTISFLLVLSMLLPSGQVFADDEVVQKPTFSDSPITNGVEVKLPNSNQGSNAPHWQIPEPNKDIKMPNQPKAMEISNKGSPVRHVDPIIVNENQVRPFEQDLIMQEKEYAAEYRNTCQVSSAAIDPKTGSGYVETSQGHTAVACNSDKITSSQEDINKGFIHKKDILQDTVAMCTMLWGEPTFYNEDVSEPNDPPAARLCEIAEARHCSEIAKKVSSCDSLSFKDMKGGSKEDKVRMSNGEDATFKVCPLASVAYVAIDGELLSTKKSEGEMKAEEACRAECRQILIGSKEADILPGKFSTSDQPLKYSGSFSPNFRPLKMCRSQYANKMLQTTVESCKALQAAALFSKERSKRLSTQDEFPSFDGKYKCYKSSLFNVDFKPCKNAVMAYNLAFAMENVGLVAEQVDSLTYQGKLQKDLQQNPQDHQIKSVEAAKKMMYRKEDHEKAKSIMFGAKGAAIATALAQWVRPATLAKKCKNDSSECCNAAAALHQDKLFENMDVKFRMVEDVVKAMGQSAAHALLSNAYRKAGDGLKEAEKELKDFEEVETAGLDMEMSLCGINPGHPSCATAKGPQGVNQATGFSGLNVGSGGGLLSSDNNFKPLEGVDNFESGLQDVDDQTKADLAQKIAAAEGQRNGFVDPSPSAAVARSARGGAGGGSGGGGAGGGSSRGLGAEPKKDDAKAAMMMNNGDKVSYGNSGGVGYGGGKYSFSGGGKKDAKNPFDGLFNKDGQSNGVRNIASDIGDKNGSGIFEKISKKYDDVKKKDRLLKYEAE